MCPHISLTLWGCRMVGLGGVAAQWWCACRPSIQCGRPDARGCCERLQPMNSGRGKAGVAAQQPLSMARRRSTCCVGHMQTAAFIGHRMLHHENLWVCRRETAAHATGLHSRTASCWIWDSTMPAPLPLLPSPYANALEHGTHARMHARRHTRTHADTHAHRHARSHTCAWQGMSRAFWTLPPSTPTELPGARPVCACAPCRMHPGAPDAGPGRGAWPGAPARALQAAC